MKEFLIFFLGLLLGVASLLLFFVLAPDNHLDVKVYIDQATMEVTKCENTNNSTLDCGRNPPDGVYVIRWVREARP